ncbi:MAG TPA: hypothetical protein VEW74_00795 [Candidatus Nitrosotalea sp.]|nr:hypothetical protein [Candidatus Nitrosotalea sp.]
MMTQELQISILAAPLAAMDRRALSQAWYSALGMAPRAARSASDCTAGGSAACAVARPRALPPALLSRKAEWLGHSLVNRTAKDSAGAVEEPSRLIHRTLLAKRIERTFARATPAPKRATFSMGRGGARVHVILQTSQAGIVLLALCRPDMRAVVAGALAQARTALAARGIALDVTPLRGFACS